MLVGLGMIFLTLTGILKTKAEKKGSVRRKAGSEKQKAWPYWTIYCLMILVGVGFNLYGSWLIKHTADIAAERRNKESQRQDADYKIKVREEVQRLANELHNAKTEEARKITEEKIKVIQMDFEQWAENLATNLPGEKRLFAERKARLDREIEKRSLNDATKRTNAEVQYTAEVHPALSFTIRFIQESIRAFAEKSGKNITIDALEVPDNIFVKSASANIHFGTNGVWTMSISNLMGLPFMGFPTKAGADLPVLGVRFRHADNTADSLLLRPLMIGGRKVLQILYTPTSPTFSPPVINGEYPLSGYEEPIRSSLPGILEAELLQLPNY